MALVVLIASGIAVFVGSPAFAGSCYQQTGVSVTDPNTGWHWSSYWYCGNAAHATMYGDATMYTPTAYMDSTSSWFVCYRRGDMHGGGNDVWYYSLGDRAVSGQEGRHNWGYMPAVSLTTSTDPWPGLPACPEAYSPAAQANRVHPVLFIHGFELNSDANCAATWNFGRSVFNSDFGFSDTHTLAYYAGDTNCTDALPNRASYTSNTSIETLSNQVAWYIYNRWSRYGDTIDVVAHSMGGLLIHEAVLGTANQYSGSFTAYTWPPYLYVENAVTLDTPFDGVTWEINTLCEIGNEFAAAYECKEMRGGSLFYTSWVVGYNNPQARTLNGRGGTDWTLMGVELLPPSDDDTVVSVESQLHWANQGIYGHRLFYDGVGDQVITHTNVMNITSGNYEYYHCDWTSTTCDQSPDPCWASLCDTGHNYAGWVRNTGEAPIFMAAAASYYHGGY
jgi:hypothetical protein